MLALAVAAAIAPGSLPEPHGEEIGAGMEEGGDLQVVTIEAQVLENGELKLGLPAILPIVQNQIARARQMKKHATTFRTRSAVLRFMLARRGVVIRKEEFDAAFGKGLDVATNVRALMALDGYRIVSARDRSELSLGDYLLETDERRPVLDRALSRECRSFALSRTDLVCRCCGSGPSDPDPYDVPRKIRLRVSLLIGRDDGGPATPENLDVVCTNCWDGLRRARLPEPPTRIELLTFARRARPLDQLALLEWLQSRYGELAAQMRTALKSLPRNPVVHGDPRGR